MSRHFQLEVSESQQTLETLLRQHPQEPYRPRLQMLYWVKSQQVSSVRQIAALLGVHEMTVTRWARHYRSGGIERLLQRQRRRGIQPRLRPEHLEQLGQRLEQPEGFESYFAIQAWIREQFGVELCYSRVHQIVYRQLKARPKVPRPKAAAREQGQAEFKKNCPAG